MGHCPRMFWRRRSWTVLELLELLSLKPTSCTRTRGKKGQPHTASHDPPRRRTNKRRGHGTYETDRPAIFSVVCRRTGEIRYFVREHSDAATCLSVVTSTVPAAARAAAAGAAARTGTLYTDEWTGYGRVGDRGIVHATVRHGRDAEGRREWARDDDGDGIREVHCNTCEGAGTGFVLPSNAWAV
jgi:transposase